MNKPDQYVHLSSSDGVAAVPQQIHQSSLMDRLGRWLVSGMFRRMFRHLESELCEPGGLPVDGIHRILISRPNHRLGNTVLVSALISEIEALYPGAEIDLVGSEATQTIYAPLFGVHRVFAFPRRIVRHLWYSASLLREIRACRYDLAIDACSGSRSGKILLHLANARFKLGFPDQGAASDSAWQGFSWPEHLAHRAVFLLRKAYAGCTRQAYPPLQMLIAPMERERAKKALDALCKEDRDVDVAPIVGIFANATGAKCYGEAWWTDFLDIFKAASPGVRIVELVAAHGQSSLADRFTPFYTRNVRHLAAMAASMDAFISADCGVMHLAAASGVPTMGLFSITDPAKYAPYGGSNTGIDTRDVSLPDAAKQAARWFAGLPLNVDRREVRCGVTGDVPALLDSGLTVMAGVT